VIVGSGGLAREFLDVVQAINDENTRLGRGAEFSFLGFVSSEADELSEARGPWLGTDEFLTSSLLDFEYVIGIGDGPIRERIDKLASDAGRSAAVLIHPMASVGSHSVNLGAGSVICANSSLTTNLVLGRHVHVNLNSTIGHDCVIEDYVSINPGVNVSGNVVIGRASMLGTGAQVIQGKSIGSETIIGAGAVVVRDIPSNVVAIGSPARAVPR
jgi:sugar O-acyltransferase (sialic acid O-acetyltransferase NeuD family)